MGCRKAQPPPPASVPVTVARAERRAVPFELAANGTVEPLQTVAVLPQVSGPILRIAFSEGQAVLGYERDAEGNGKFLIGTWDEKWAYGENC